MGKTTKIKVKEKLISIVKRDEQDYICLTDMVRDEEGRDHIRNWMRNRNTVEFIGLWENCIIQILNQSNSTPLETN